MIYVIYLILVALIVVCSNQASKYIDLIEKNSSLSGAFLGGVVLSAVTSLPELFTSITSTILLDKPSLCIGNILGSNLYNLMILAVLTLVAYKSVLKSTISKSHLKVTLMVLLIYISIILGKIGILHVEIFTINITSLIIIALYMVGIKFMAAENGDMTFDELETEREHLQVAVHGNLSLKQLVVRFICVSIGIIGFSICITYVTDIIAVKHNLSHGLAGALFLGVATSLPEVASTISLFRLKNYNIGISNIIGSNIFNLFILAISDLLYFGKGVYDFTDPKASMLLIMGTIATTTTALFLAKRSKWTIWCPIVVIASYLCFLFF